MSAIDEALRANQQYQREFHQESLRMPPSRKLAVVACMDARIQVEDILGLKPGEAHIIRNAGGIVTEDALRSLIISQQLLGTEEVMIVNHTDCGMLTFHDDELRQRLIEQSGRVPIAPERFYSFANLEQNVLEQISKLDIHPWLAKNMKVRGFVYDVKNGSLNEVEPMKVRRVA